MQVSIDSRYLKDFSVCMLAVLIFKLRANRTPMVQDPSVPLRGLSLTNWSFFHSFCTLEFSFVDFLPYQKYHEIIVEAWVRTIRRSRHRPRVLSFGSPWCATAIQIDTPHNSNRVSAPEGTHGLARGTRSN